MRHSTLSGCHPWWMDSAAFSAGGLGRHKKRKKKTFLNRRVFVVGVIFACLQLVANKVSGVGALGNHRNHHHQPPPPQQRTHSNLQLDDDLNLDASEDVRFLPAHPNTRPLSHHADSFSSVRAHRVRRQATYYDQYSSGDYDLEAPGDDEDYVDGGGSGLGEDDLTVQISVIIEEPWNDFLLDKGSSAHLQLTRRIQGGFDGYYEDIDGTQMVRVLRFAPTTRKEILAVLEMTISGTPNVEDIKDILIERLREGRIGDLAIGEGGPSWWHINDSPGPSTSKCLSNELFCPSGECIGTDRLCDGIRDCLDASDELECSNQCNFDQHECDYGFCIDKSLICDGKVDCPSDDSDERNCPDANIIPSPLPQPVGCRADTQIVCPGSNTRICEFQACDGVENCPKNPLSDAKSWDEEDCPVYSNITFETPTTEKPRLTFSVTVSPKVQIVPVGSTITLDCSVEPNDYLGTRIPSLDWNKEEGSMPLNRITLGPLGTSMQISSVKKSDAGTYICSGMASLNGVLVKKSDESVLQIKLCESDEFSCETGECLKSYERCNYVKDCPGGEDEFNCPCQTPDLLCGDGSTCIESGKVCNGFRDCPTGEDESNCEQECPGFVCQSDSKCILNSQVCDYNSDCDDQSDELNCPCDMETEFPCDPSNPPGGQCLPLDMKCDSYPDCPDGRDEDNCPITTCRPDQFTCDTNPFSGAICISSNLRCDGQSDCDNDEDERGCPNPTCRPNQFTCDSNSITGTVCISMDQKCNGEIDCDNGEDERGCPNPTCQPDQFTCDSNSITGTVCISMDQKCNGEIDCDNGEDERGCPSFTCRPDQFTCETNFFSGAVCISSNLRCDGQSDCDNDEDERGCPSPTCRPDQFTCDSNPMTGTVCISMDQKCNGRIDCDNGEDERDCPLVCASNEVKCPGADICAIPCNNFMECPTGEDELNCQTTTTPIPPTPPPTPSCRPNEFECRDGTCISVDLVCNLEDNCVDGSDEDPNRCACDPPNIRCSSGRCLDQRRVCDGFDDCDDGFDEFNCKEERPPALPSRTCGPAEATCANGDCVLKSLVCDGNFDCADGSDERNCRGGDGCEPNEFQCDNKRCVLKTWRCDSDDDCGDQSDESFCATNPPGSPCKYHEWMCQTGDQCIPKSFHCDGEMDCQDQSDEIGCTPPIILESPPAQVIVDPSFTFVINCTAMGIPTPEIVWRLNWGHVPDKCSMTSTPEVVFVLKRDSFCLCGDGNRAFGELTCPNAMDMDQGAYSCEVINSKGSCFAGSPGCGQPGQDAIVVLRRPDGICSPGQFNTNAMSEKECLPCFCFGITEECSSAELFLTETRIPNNGYILVGVSVDSSGMASIEPNIQGGELLKSTRAGQIAFSQDTRSFGSNTPFFKLPIDGNQLKSYGAYLSLNLRYSGFGDPTQAPTLVLIGNDLTLMYIVPSNELKANEANALKIRLWEGLWFKRAYPNGQGVQGGVPATRNEIMMALQNVQHLLIKGQYLSDVVDTTIESLKIGSAENQDQGLGPATLVEQCRCPKGYMGLSCEECAPDYERVQQGPWKGVCRQPVASCPPGYYGDPSGGMECQVCPCPLQSPSNQFGRECYLDNDREVTCRCPMGYEGRRCDQCAPGYNGNPTIPGDFCKPDIIIQPPTSVCANNRRLECFDGLLICDEKRCDGVIDCSQGEDELNCGNGNPNVQCLQANWMFCLNGQPFCPVQRCDGIRDCPDARDEQGCIFSEGPAVPPFNSFPAVPPTNSPVRPNNPSYNQDEACTADEFACLDGTCIPKYLRCNGVTNCRDLSDEVGCQSCQSDQFQCPDAAICIPITGLCDGIKECPDGADERDCLKECRQTEYQCNDGACIRLDQRCDGVLQCADFSDEQDCPIKCGDNEFLCYNGLCIALERKCDGWNQCPFGEDELNCPSKDCDANEFQCAEGKCVDRARRCDGRNDCADASDEANCPKRCSTDDFVCSDGSCVPKSSTCDGMEDCRDGSDEEGCAVQCSSQEISCADGSCIPLWMRCNGRMECQDGSDERNCANCSPESEYDCGLGTCIGFHQRCDGKADCPNRSDEANCPQTQCQITDFQCDNGQCVDQIFRCDRNYDCNDGSDEFGCFVTCKPDEFQCRDQTCIPEWLVCDGSNHCNDGSDEDNCSTTATCSSKGGFICDGRCLNASHRCDGKPDCRSGLDEINCSSAYPAPKFECCDGTQILATLQCNSRLDCPDGSDEFYCSEPLPFCNIGEFSCSDGRCLPLKLRCNGQNDCSDGSDEACGCSDYCRGEEYFLCEDNLCLSINPGESIACDGVQQCMDGSDEKGCFADSYSCSANEFRCYNGQCIPLWTHCDGMPQCSDLSDELHCPPIFQCLTTHECIHLDQKCDGVEQCSDGSDEINCFWARPQFL
eukprot:TCALIF_07546-PA protein Name:"Similar to Hspg2 Basement membrane-specific heparan sulfate proteoglycan core protein (Mus musculus)" AED:0.27 eAED:0.27 QI:67/0.56/0.38/1/0.8/0.76/26/0/2378